MKRASELVLTAEGLPYHTRLGAEHLSDNVILVGDPGRVALFKNIFDSVLHESYNREIHVLTGRYHGTDFTVVSTGMGCDNIDIVLTELDLAANVDLATGEPHPAHRTLRIVRIGTCGSLHAELPCGSFVASAYAVGLDGLLNYYRHEDVAFADDLEQAFCEQVAIDPRMARPYAVAASDDLLHRIAGDMVVGITVTAPGFYAPQGRFIRKAPTLAHLAGQLAGFRWNGLRVNNLEMETSGIYGMARMLGHEALTVCLVISNRADGTFISQYTRRMEDIVLQIMQQLASGC
ncbi:MAG: uridine phosphorylase [bacterium P3]|nr:MAG: uridine phosphorylase [bacterium P3]KWW42209.1 MAG: uridine phosphorylase [bacterium F083]